MSPIRMSEQLENHAKGLEEIALVAYDGERSVWVVDGGSEDPTGWTLPTTARVSGESIFGTLRRLADEQLGGRVQCLRPHYAARGSPKTAYYGGWLPRTQVTERRGARLCPLDRKNLPDALKKAFGKNSMTPDLSPHLRAIQSLVELWRLGYCNLTMTAWIDEQGWHMEIIPTSLISLHGYSWAEMMSEVKQQQILHVGVLASWHRDLAALGQHPIQHHGASNPLLFGGATGGERPEEVARRLTRQRMAACMAGYGHDNHNQSRWVPDPGEILVRARTLGVPVLRWERTNQVLWSWEALDQEA
jgi:hypothetical protein